MTLPALRAQNARRRAGEGGFTLTELLVGLAITTVIFGAVFTTLLNLQRSWTASQDQVEMSRNERAGVELMVRDIRMAGSGFGGRPLITGGFGDTTRVFCLDPKPGVTGPDTLVVTAGFDGVSTTSSASMGSPADIISVSDATGFAVDDLVVVTDGLFANMFQITDVDLGANSLTHESFIPYNVPSGHAIWPNGGYASGASVVKVQRVSYWIENNKGALRLMRRFNDGEVIPVATDVKSLKLAYRLIDGTVTNAPGDPSMIRGVVLRYVRPETRGFEDYGTPSASDTLALNIQPRVLG